MEVLLGLQQPAHQDVQEAAIRLISYLQWPTFTLTSIQCMMELQTTSPKRQKFNPMNPMPSKAPHPCPSLVKLELTSAIQPIPGSVTESKQHIIRRKRTQEWRPCLGWKNVGESIFHWEYGSYIELNNQNY